jgi:hypothetical protein
VWAADVDHIVSTLAKDNSRARGSSCTVAHNGFKILGAPVGSRTMLMAPSSALLDKP